MYTNYIKIEKVNIDKHYECTNEGFEFSKKKISQFLLEIGTHMRKIEDKGIESFKWKMN